MKQKKERTFWKDFKKFISRGNVVDMAIGVVVATSFSAIVSKFTAAFISPLIALLTDGASLADLKWVARPETLDAEGNVLVAEVSFAWGAFVQAIIDFLIIALVLFIVLRIVSKASNKAKKLRISRVIRRPWSCSAKSGIRSLPNKKPHRGGKAHLYGKLSFLQNRGRRDPVDKAIRGRKNSRIPRYQPAGAGACACDPKDPYRIGR